MSRTLIFNQPIYWNVRPSMRSGPHLAAMQSPSWWVRPVCLPYAQEFDMDMLVGDSVELAGHYLTKQGQPRQQGMDVSIPLLLARLCAMRPINTQKKCICGLFSCFWPQSTQIHNRIRGICIQLQACLTRVKLPGKSTQLS